LYRFHEAAAVAVGVAVAVAVAVAIGVAVAVEVAVAVSVAVAVAVAVGFGFGGDEELSPLQAERPQATKTRMTTNRKGPRATIRATTSSTSYDLPGISISNPDSDSQEHQVFAMRGSSDDGCAAHSSYAQGYSVPKFSKY
jgi:hypothetical protein